MGSNFILPWTSDEVAVLKKLWNVQGLSATDCVRVLWEQHGISRSRNSVIGVIHRHKGEFEARASGRLVLPQRPKKTPSPRSPSRSASPRRGDLSSPTGGEARALPPKPVDRGVYDSEARRVPLADLGWRDCKFPVNDAAPGETHLFCGKPQDPDSSYCAHHRLRCAGGYSSAAAMVGAPAIRHAY